MRKYTSVLLALLLVTALSLPAIPANSSHGVEFGLSLVESSQESVTVEWDHAYIYVQIWRDGESLGWYRWTSREAKDMQHIDNNVEPGEEYEYWATAHDGFGTQHGKTNVVEVSIPDNSSEFDHVFSGSVSENGFTVPEGETWAFDPDTDTTVQTDANVVVEGTLEMKPSSEDVTHTLKFTDVDETQFVGGGMEVLESDVGLWVVENGQLDLQGTEKAGWNRTGDDPTWNSTDEIRVVPNEKGDTTTFSEFTLGSEVPSVTAPDGSEHKTEVFNLTRNVKIHGGGENPPDEILSDNGRAHVICLACNKPQTIEYVEFRWLGPREPDDRDKTDGRRGRYPLHFHHSNDGTRGTEVIGTVVRDSGSRAYVPHTSHGITFRDTISFDVYESAYWWDSNDETHDLLYDHTASFFTRDYPNYRGYSLDGYTLGEGINMTVRDSVVAGMQGKSVNSGGFHWPSKANLGNNVWNFENNVAHNNRHNGISVWQNDANDHVVKDFVSYNNMNGINHGAYRNSYQFIDGLLFGNNNGIVQHALSSGGGPMNFIGLDLNNIYIDSHSLDSGIPVIYKNSNIRGKVVVDEGNAQDGVIEFRYDCDHTDLILSPDDFEVKTMLSDISIVNECSGETTQIN